MIPTLQSEYVAKVLAERGQLASTQANYMLTRMNLAGITGRDLDAARTALRLQVSAESCNRIMNEVRSFLQWARKTERIVISKDTIADCLPPFPEEKRKLELPDQSQIRRMLELVLAHKRNRTAHIRQVCMSLFAGLRPGEVETLQPSNITSKYMHITDTKTGVERHAYFTHSAVLKPTMLRIAADPETLASKGRHFLPVAFERAGWTDCTRNTLRKLCESYCACSGQFTEYDMIQQFGHSQLVSLQHYRDRRILDVIKPGDCIEEWMGIADLVPELKKAVIGTQTTPSTPISVVSLQA